MSDNSIKKIKYQGRGWILSALMFTTMLAAMDATIVSTAIPQIVGDLGGFSLFSWVFSIYLLAQMVTIPIYGKLADIYGRKPILIFGTVIFLIGSAASAASWDMVSLIVFRGVQGLGAGSIMATVNTIAGDIYSIKERAKIQGWLSSVWGMAAIAGPTLGGAFVEYANWRWIFLINIPIGIVSIFLLILFFKEKIVKKKHYVDIPGAILIFLAGGLIIYTLMEGGTSWPWYSAIGIGFISLSVLLIGLIIYVQKKSPEPIMPAWVWRRKILLGSNLAVIFMGAIMLGPNMYLPIFSQSVLGLGPIAAGFVLASMSIGWPVASSFSGMLYLRIGFRNTALIGTFCIIIFSLFFSALPFDVSVWVVVTTQVLLGAGFGLLSTSSMVGIQSIVPWEKRGVVTSANMFSRYLGQSLGAAILGGIFNASIRKDIKLAPSGLKEHLPKVNDVVDVLQSGEVAETVKEYLVHAFYTATHHVYLVMAFFGVLAILCLLLLPRRFPIVDEKIEEKMNL